MQEFSNTVQRRKCRSRQGLGLLSFGFSDLFGDGRLPLSALWYFIPSEGLHLLREEVLGRVADVLGTSTETRRIYMNHGYMNHESRKMVRGTVLRAQ